jgi:hypothetical protein
MSEILTLNQKLVKIQSELKAPKNAYNAFGKYKYRSCEDILEALKPILKDNNCYLVIGDEVKLIGDRYYIEATSMITCGDSGKSIVAKALAREPDNQKGMNEAQITGSASSYARKYSLNGLFCIDDTKDADTQDNTVKTQSKTSIGIDEIIASRLAENKEVQGNFKPSEAQLKLLRSMVSQLNENEIKALKNEVLQKSDCVNLIKKYKD